jgi:hypothetical protein
LKAKTGERHSHLSEPAFLIYHRLDIPESIEIPVDPSARGDAPATGIVGDGCVFTDPPRRGREQDSRLIVVEGVE